MLLVVQPWAEMSLHMRRVWRTGVPELCLTLLVILRTSKLRCLVLHWTVKQSRVQVLAEMSPGVLLLCLIK